MNNQEFEVGDIVTKPSGKKPFKLTYVPPPGQESRWNPYKGFFIDSGAATQAERVVHYGGGNQDKKTIYSFTDENGEEVLGMFIGTNSKGQYILEVDDGRNDYVVKDPKQVEEVIPFTFSVDITGKEIHYIGEPGKVFEGDFLLQKSGKGAFEVVQVKNTDTKNKQARPKFNGFKLITENIF